MLFLHMMLHRCFAADPWHVTHIVNCSQEVKVWLVIMAPLVDTAAIPFGCNKHVSPLATIERYACIFFYKKYFITYAIVEIVSGLLLEGP